MTGAVRIRFPGKKNMEHLGIWQKELPCLLKARVRPAFTGQDCTEPQTMRREFLKRMFRKQISMRQTVGTGYQL